MEKRWKNSFKNRTLVKLLEPTKQVSSAITSVLTDNSDVLVWQPQTLSMSMQIVISVYIIPKTTVDKGNSRDLLPTGREGLLYSNVLNLTSECWHVFLHHVDSV